MMRSVEALRIGIRLNPAETKFLDFSPQEIGIYAVFFNTFIVAEAFVPPTMDVTMDIGIRNLRFCAVCSKHENDRMVRR